MGHIAGSKEACRLVKSGFVSVRDKLRRRVESRQEVAVSRCFSSEYSLGDKYDHHEVQCLNARVSCIPDALPRLGRDADWREVRAMLLSRERAYSVSEVPEPAPHTVVPPSSDSHEPRARWAHCLPLPEKGCLLLANPRQFQFQQQFEQSVLLLVEHDPQHGSWGVLLNRPSCYTLGDLGVHNRGSGNDVVGFDDCRLYIGGDMGGDEARIIHPFGHLEGVTEVVKGVYHGGVEAVLQAVSHGKLESDEFRWLVGYVGWAPGQLEEECQRGNWLVAAASPSVILGTSCDKGADMWHDVLQLCGDETSVMSELVMQMEAGYSLAADPADTVIMDDNYGYNVL